MALPASFALQSALASPPASPSSSAIDVSYSSSTSSTITASQSLQALLAASPILPEAPLTPKLSLRRLLPAPTIIASAPSSLKLAAPARSIRTVTPPPTSKALKFATFTTPFAPCTPKPKQRLAESPIPRTPTASQQSSKKRRREDSDEECAPLRTPKRARITPETLPMGISRAEFQAVFCSERAGLATPTASSVASSERHSCSSSVVDSDSESECEWDEEDDRALVQAVLRKIQLSTAEWSECSETIGRKPSSVGRRWTRLVTGGSIGLSRLQPAACL